MKVSIILPTLNRGAVLGKAIQSVLDQTYVDWELIIVDGGSGDDTLDVIRSFADVRVQHIVFTEPGQALARNKGLDIATGDFVAFLDSDDTYREDHLEKLVAYVREHPDTDLVLASLAIVGDPYIPDVHNHNEMVHSKECLITGRLFVRRSILEDVGRFPLLDYGEDYYLVQKLKEKGAHVAAIADKTYIYDRTGEDSICNIMKQKVL